MYTLIFSGYILISGILTLFFKREQTDYYGFPNGEFHTNKKAILLGFSTIPLLFAFALIAKFMIFQGFPLMGEFAVWAYGKIEWIYLNMP